MVKEKGMQFFIINMKMKRKRDKKIDLPQRGFEPRIFERIPAQNLNFEGDQINLRISQFYRPKLYVFFLRPYNEIEITLCILVTCERYLITVKSQFKDFLLSKILSVCTKCPKWLKKSTYTSN